MKDIREVLIEVYEENAVASKEQIRLVTEKINNPDRALDQEINQCSGQITAYKKVIKLLKNYIAEETAHEG